MALFTLGISQLIRPWVISALPLNHPTARNDIPFGLLSARLGVAARTVVRTATHSVAYRTIRMTLLPPLASEFADDLLCRKLHERRPADVLQAHEADAPVRRLLVVLHGEGQRGGREATRNIGRKARALEKPLEPVDRRGPAS